MGMLVRSDFKKGLAADMHTWYWESAEKHYKKKPSIIPDICDLSITKEEIKGGFYQGTSAIAARKLLKVDNYGTIKQDNPQEGFTVYGKVKQAGLEIVVPRELSRDWHRTSDFIQKYMKDNGAQMVENAKLDIILDFFNYGGYTAGYADAFNNDDAEIGLSTYSSPNLIYDGSPLFARTALHTAKNSSTYLNAVAITTAGVATAIGNGVNFANAATMWNLLTSTNAKMENGQPFDNTEGVFILTHQNNKMDWDALNNSTLNPDNAANASNPLQGVFSKIVGTPLINTSTFSFMGRKYLIKAYFSEPYFDIYEKKNPNQKVGQILMDYVTFVPNWRFGVTNNAPQS